MKNFVVLVLLLLPCLKGFAQDKVVDSLLTTLHLLTNDDTNKVVTLYQLTSELYYSDANRAVQYGKQAVALADQQGYKRGAAKSLNNLGLSYYMLGAYDEAAACFFRSMRIREDSLNGEGLQRTYNNLGLVFDATGDYDKAQDYYQKALDIAIALDDSSAIGNGYMNLAILIIEKDNLQGGLDKMRTAQPYFESDSMGLSKFHHNIGVCHAELEQFDSAAFYYAKALEINRKLGDLFEISNIYGNMARMNIQQGKYSEADSLLHLALSIDFELENASGVNAAYRTLSELYSITHQWDSAYKYEQLYRISSDSLYKSDAGREIALLELRYQTEKEQREQNIIREAEKRENRLFTLFLVAILVTATGFSIWLYNRVRLIRRQKAVIEFKNKEITDSITYARRLQEAILPPEKFVRELFPASFVFYRPRDIVAGDFYWIEKSVDGLVYFAVADCTGHGVPGAMVSVVCSNALNRALLEMKIKMPGEILNTVRELVLETFEKSESQVYDGMDIALCAIDRTNHKLYYAGAYNPLWLIRTGDDVLTEVKADKQPIGKFEVMNSFTTHEIIYRPGDWIYLFTDGYADQFGGDKGKKFKYSRLKSLLLENYSRTPEAQCSTVQSALEQWQGSHGQVDDICVAGIQL